MIDTIMDTSNSITAAIFSAFLKCPTKAYLLAIGEPIPNSFFTDIEARISSRYKSEVTRRLRVGAEVAEPRDFGVVWGSRGREAIAHPVDFETAIYSSVLPGHEPGGGQAHESTASATFVPVSFSPWDKLDVSDNLLVCFGALALLQITGILADTGTVISAKNHPPKTVTIADHTAGTDRNS